MSFVKSSMFIFTFLYLSISVVRKISLRSRIMSFALFFVSEITLFHNNLNLAMFFLSDPESTLYMSVSPPTTQFTLYGQ